jgi:hypothetical protein
MRIRHSLSALSLFSVVKDSTVKRVGYSRILNGLDIHGVVHEDEVSCWAMQMQVLSKGITFDMPRVESIKQGESPIVTVRLVAYHITYMADKEALYTKLPFSDGPNAARDCDKCNRQQKVKGYVPTAFVFTAACTGKAKKTHSIVDETGCWHLRTESETLEQVLWLTGLSFNPPVNLTVNLSDNLTVNLTVNLSDNLSDNLPYPVILSR